MLLRHCAVAEATQTAHLDDELDVGRVKEPEVARVGSRRSGCRRSGYFWFFDSANVELIIKVLDARVLNGKFWLFYGALSNVEYTITVTDTETGRVKTYFNPSATLASVADTSAF